MSRCLQTEKKRRHVFGVVPKRKRKKAPWNEEQIENAEAKRVSNDTLLARLYRKAISIFRGE